VLPSKLTLTSAAVGATSMSSMVAGIQSRTSSSRKLTGEAAAAPGSPSKETILSVGRVFHILTLNEPVVRVKSYSPRHPFPRTSYDYTYRFRVPDSPTGFDTSWTQFTCEPLELYRWNYVDQYLSTRGEDRTFRLQVIAPFVLPGNLLATLIQSIAILFVYYARVYGSGHRVMMQFFCPSVCPAQQCILRAIVNAKH